MEKRVKIFNALAGATFAVAVMLAGSSATFAAAAVSHPAPVAKAAQADGAIVVAKKGRNAAIVGGIVAGAIGCRDYRQRSSQGRATPGTPSLPRTPPAGACRSVRALRL